MPSKPKILIDTDIGDNLDDAFAILAAMSLNFEIVGITTVFRDTENRARMAKKLLAAFGRGYEQVPVFAGFSSYSGSDSDNTAYAYAFDSDLLQPAYAPKNTKPEEAIHFIIECCHRYGEELTVVALGPFSNIAKVIQKDPNALAQVGSVVIMGGAYFMQYADWNVMCDVPAAELMFQSLNNLECIGADVTHHLADSGFLAEMLISSVPANKAFQYIKDLHHKWQQANPEEPLILHDVLVIYYLHDPSICTMQTVRAVVIPEGFAKGLTLNVDSYSKQYLNPAYQVCNPIGTVSVASDVNLDKFHQFVRSNISACILPQILPQIPS